MAHRIPGVRDPSSERHPVALLQPELYRMRDAATVLGISERMVYSLVEIGELVAVRLPGTGSRRSAVRIARVDLLDFVERRRAAVRMAR